MSAGLLPSTTGRTPMNTRSGRTAGARFGRVRSASEVKTPATTCCARSAGGRSRERRRPECRGRNVAHRLHDLIDENRTGGEEHRGRSARDRTVHATAEQVGAPDRRALRAAGTTRWSANAPPSFHAGAITSDKPGAHIGTAPPLAAGTNPTGANTRSGRASGIVRASGSLSTARPAANSSA